MALRASFCKLFSNKLALAKCAAPTSVFGRNLSHYPINDQMYGLSEDQQKLRETAFNFFQKELAPFAKEIDKTDNFP